MDPNIYCSVHTAYNYIVLGTHRFPLLVRDFKILFIITIFISLSQRAVPDITFQMASLVLEHSPLLQNSQTAKASLTQ